MVKYTKMRLDTQFIELSVKFHEKILSVYVFKL